MRNPGPVGRTASQSWRRHQHAFGIQMPEKITLPIGREPITDRFHTIRRVSERLCDPLVIDDYLLQSNPDCSPPKWHLAHTTWFFEAFVLAKHEPGYRPHHSDFSYLFNSYTMPSASVGHVRPVDFCLDQRWPRFMSTDGRSTIGWPGC